MKTTTRCLACVDYTRIGRCCCERDRHDPRCRFCGTRLLTKEVRAGACASCDAPPTRTAAVLAE